MDKIDSVEGSPISTEALIGIIEHEQIITHFQPIISLKNSSLLGFEALSRAFDDQGKIILPNILFDAARRQGKSVEMDRLCRGKALHQFYCMKASGQCGRTPLLFLNFDTSLLDQGVAGSGFLRKQVSQLNIPPSQVIIEIVENQVKDIAALGRFIHDYRNQGFIIALDDVGAGYSNFDRITIIKPDIIKIDRSIISNINCDYYKQEIFKALVRLSRKIGTLVLAEGVESIEECLSVLNYDADLLQGFFFARPAAPASIFSAGLNDIAAHTANRFREYKINKINRISDQYRTYHEIIEGMKSTLSVNPPDRFETVLKTMIESLPLIEAVYVLDENGIMMTDTILRECRWAKANMLFQKAGQGDNLSLKEYYYLLIFTGLQHYVTESYISWATGNLTRTMSASFKGLMGKMCVLCIDVQVDSTLDSDSFSDEKRSFDT
jgi:EAL domain-containing protein (putative c-di-GMP-specific phosphodiesterase class I)